MSDRLVVAVEFGFGNQIGVRLMITPQPYPDYARPEPFVCPPEEFPAWSVQQAVAKYGNLLRQKLTSAHPAVNRALADRLSARAGEVRPLYFMITADPAEGLHWESLCTDDGTFLALDRRWPIGRIAHSGRDLFGVPARQFEPPVRILAVISALGVDGRPEWRRLYEAVQDARKAGLPVRLRVLVGEEPLLEEIRALGDPEVQVEPLAGGSGQLEREVNAFIPHILHFFCHGSTGFGTRLEFATIADRDDDQRTTGSVLLSGAQLGNLQAIKDVWLVTLNCCSGAQGGPDVRSMAHTLVADGGVPAVVGMTEPVDASDAHAFCGAFYSSVLEEIRTAAQAASDAPVEVEWARGLYLPRLKLAEAHQDAAQSRQWLLPVLYVGVSPFTLQPVPAVDRAARTQESLVNGTITTMGPDAPPALVQDLQTLVQGLSATPAAGGG